MKTLIKILAWSAGIFVLTAVIAAVFIKIYLPPEKIRTLALEQISRALKREVTLESASFSLKKMSLDLKGIAVSESPDFSKGKFIKAQSLRIQPKLKPLFQKRVEIYSLAADKVFVYIRQHKRGTYNFSDILEPAPGVKPAEKPQEKTKAGSAVSVHISKLLLENSAVVYDDPASASRYTVSNLYLRARDISLTKPFAVETEFSLNVKSPLFKGTLPVKTIFDMNLSGETAADFSAKIKSLRTSWEKLSASMSGEIRNFTEPDVSAKLEIEPFNSTSLRKLFPTLPRRVVLLPGIEADSSFKLRGDYMEIKSLSVVAGPAAAKISGIFAWAPEISYRLKISEFEAALPEADSSDIAQRFPSVPKNLKIPAVKFSGNAEITPGKIKISRLKVKFGGTTAEISSNISMAGPRTETRLSVKAALRFEDAAEIMPDLKQYEPAGKAEGRISLAILKDKTDYSCEFAVTDARARYSDIELSEISGNLSANPRTIKMPDVSGKLQNSDFNAEFAVSDFMNSPKINFSAELAALDLAGFKTLMAQSPSSDDKTAASASGQGAGRRRPAARQSAKDFAVKGSAVIHKITHPNFTGDNAALQCDLKNITPSLERISGKASFTVNGGRLYDLSDFAQNNPAAKVFLFPVITIQKALRTTKIKMLPNFDDMPYSLMEGKYEFQNGVMKIIKSSLDSETVKVNSSGIINLPRETLDMKIQVRLLPASGINMPDPVTMTVKGTVSDPNVKIDIASVINQSGIKKEVIEQGKNLLKSFLRNIK